jgi:rsbT co-antagonist protein RsbR
MSKMKEALYQFLLDNKTEIIEEWMNRRKNDVDSFFSAQAPKYVETELKEEADELVLTVSRVFIEEDIAYQKFLLDWAVKIGEKRAQNNTTLQEVIFQFKVFKQIYLNYVNEFILKNENISIENVVNWNSQLNLAFDNVIEVFTSHYREANKQLLQSQQEIINELSSPIIPITETIAVLPLIGDIDTTRAKIIQESSLSQCAERSVETLFIDLSGVPIVDTMVAQQIFHVISSLQLIGVKSVLSGIRPEVAQTAIQLGIDFSTIRIEPNLSQALKQIDVLSSAGR